MYTPPLPTEEQHAHAATYTTRSWATLRVYGLGQAGVRISGQDPAAASLLAGRAKMLSVVRIGHTSTRGSTPLSSFTDF